MYQESIDKLYFYLFLCRFALSSMDMGLKDYDSRTALHIAAAEGEPRLISSSVLLIFTE